MMHMQGRGMNRMTRIIALCAATIILLSVICFYFYRKHVVSQHMTDKEIRALADRMSARRQPDGENYSGLPYRIWIPPTSERPDKLPLVLFLHSAGANGDDNLKQLDYVVQRFAAEQIQNQFPAIVAAPQCPAGQQWTDLKAKSFPLGNYRIEDKPESTRIRALVGLVEGLKQEFPAIDANRVYVAGFSMGSSGAWDLLIRHPHVFGGALLMSGVSAPNSADKVGNIPIWTFHGVFDRVSPAKNTSEMVKAIEAKGGHIRYSRVLWNHMIPRLVLQNDAAISWLFEQKRTTASSREIHE